MNRNAINYLPALFLALGAAALALAQAGNNPPQGRSAVNIQEADGSPSGRVRTLVVTNGDLTDDGSGQFTLLTAGSATATDDQTLAEVLTSGSVTGGSNVTVTSGDLIDTSAGDLDLDPVSGIVTIDDVGDAANGQLVIYASDNSTLTATHGGTNGSLGTSSGDLDLDPASGAVNVNDSADAVDGSLVVYSSSNSTLTATHNGTDGSLTTSAGHLGLFPQAGSRVRIYGANNKWASFRSDGGNNFYVQTDTGVDFHLNTANDIFFGPSGLDTTWNASQRIHCDTISSTQNNTDLTLSGDGTGDVAISDALALADDAVIHYGTGDDVFQQGELTTLTDGVATTVFSVVTADGDMPGLTISYTIQSTDGTEYQTEHGEVLIAITDDAGGVVRTIQETSVQALSSGSLLTTWEVDVTDDQSLEVTLNADTDLTPTTHQVRWHVIASGDVTLTVP